jgi:hypothetical protein
MNMQRCHLSLLLILFVCINLSAQRSTTAIPLSITEGLPILASFVTTPEVNNAVSRVQDQSATGSNRLKNLKFATMLPVNLSPENSGAWYETSQGLVWRLGIRSKNAYSIYLTLNDFFLNKDVRLFVYSPDYREFRGAFTQANNTALNVFSIAPIAGESVIIELNIPPGKSAYGKLRVSKIYHDYMNEFGKDAAAVARTETTPCDENINCSNGKYWQTEKRAVCRIISDGALSTGTLIGNTSGDMEPYLITSHHTMFDDVHAAESIFYFNFENSCSSGSVNEGQTLSGASLIATTDNTLDFALIKLNDIPPMAYTPYYVGWDLSDASPNSGVCIHHPLGIEKQIAIDYHTLSTGSFGQNFDLLSAWRIANWEIGTTEGGSSGSPLFNERHRLVGTLTGGEANCYNPRNDYFSKFNLAWDKYTGVKNQLKVWLDKKNRGFLAIDGYDPYGFNIETCDTTWNFQDKAFDLSSTALDWGWISGHNSSRPTQFAEAFSSPGSIQLPGIFMNVAKAYYSKPLASVVVKVWEGNTIPTEEKCSKIVFIKDMVPEAINYITFDSIVKVTGNFFIGYEVNYDNPVDSFAVFHTVRERNSSASTMYVYNETWRNVDAIPPSGFGASLGIGIVECYGKIRKPAANAINIYPNPARNYIAIDTPPEMIIYDLECFDGSGRKVPIAFHPSEENNRATFNLPSGIYILKIVTKEKQFFSKFIVSKNN